jgi:hypothetical protein
MSAAVFDVGYPRRFDRAQVVLRVVILVLVALIGIPVGWILYLGFPALAAVMITQKDGARYLAEDGARVTGWVGWMVTLLAYIWQLTDRLPGVGEAPVRFDVEPTGMPTVGSALFRIIAAIPSAFVLVLLMLVSAIVWVIAAVWILIDETYPESLFGFQRGVIRWTARLLAYLASLVESYPPFSLDTGSNT